MGESSSTTAPSSGTVRETASIRKVTRKTRPLKELPETRQTEAVSRGSGARAQQVPGPRPQEQASHPAPCYSGPPPGLVSKGFSCLLRSANTPLFFLSLPMVWGTLISVPFQTVR